MANEQLTQLPTVGSINTGTLTYVVDNNISYNAQMQQVLQFIASQYYAQNMLSQLPNIPTLSTGSLFYTVNAGTSYNLSLYQLASYINSYISISFGYVDGGSFSDNYVGMSGIDGGSFSSTYSSYVDGGTF